MKLLAALLAGMRITTPLTTLLRKEPPPKGKPRKGGELKQIAIGSHSLAALLAGMRITTPLTTLLRKEPPPKGKPRKDGEFKQTSLGSLSFATLPKGETRGRLFVFADKEILSPKVADSGRGGKAGIISLLLPFVQGVPLLYRGAPAGTRCPQSAQGR